MYCICFGVGEAAAVAGGVALWRLVLRRIWKRIWNRKADHRNH